MGSEPVCPECLCVIDSDTGCACPDTTTCTICGTRVEGVGVEHQRECNGALWRTRAHAAERRAAVLAALLGCAGDIAAETFANGGSRGQVIGQLAYLANATATLCEHVEWARDTIKNALGAAGLTIEDLDVLEEAT